MKRTTQDCQLYNLQSERGFNELNDWYYYVSLSIEVLYDKSELNKFCFSWQLQFLQSEFRGQLPQMYSDLDNGTMMLPSNMNDANLEEISRYVSYSFIQRKLENDQILQMSATFPKLLGIPQNISFLKLSGNQDFVRIVWSVFITNK